MSRKIYFSGNRKNLMLFLDYLVERYGRDISVADIANFICK